MAEESGVATGGHRKVIVINQWWAGIFAAIISTIVGGGIAYAFQARADFSVLQSQVDGIMQANIPERMAKIEIQGQATAAGIARVERSQERMDDKLDRVLTRLPTAE